MNANEKIMKLFKSTGALWLIRIVSVAVVRWIAIAMVLLVFLLFFDVAIAVITFVIIFG